MSLDCDGLQPAHHLFKSLSRSGTDFQCCDWLSRRCNNVIHPEQWLYLYKAHSARHVPGGKYKIGKENQKFPSGIISFPYYIQIALNLLEILYNMVKH